MIKTIFSPFLGLIHFFQRHPMNTTIFITLIALYHATVLNIVYFKQVLSHLPLDSWEAISFFLTMPVVIFCAVFLLLSVCYFRWLIKLISILLVLIGASILYFMNTYSVLIDRGMLENALQTNVGESLSYLSFSLIFTNLCLGILPALLILLIRLKKERFLRYTTQRVLGGLAVILIAWLISLGYFKQYATFMRNHEQIIRYVIPSNYISAVISEYKFQRYQNTPWREIGLDAQRNRDAQKPVLFVVIVGETARSDHFSLYGYDKETNPLLSQQSDLFVFKDSISCGTYTAYSVPCMFSKAARSSYNPKVHLREDNLLDILARAGVDIYWFDNNGGCKGVCDRIPNQDSTKVYQQAKSEHCQTGACFDEILLEDLKKQLQVIDEQQKKDPNQQDHLIVLHAIGSHGPTYYLRYPDEFKQFTPSCDSNEIDKCSSEALINTYDNTILYTDYMINTVIEDLKPYQDQFEVGMIYLSDHGESLGENGVYLHGLPYSIAPMEQKIIPFMMWMPPSNQMSLGLDAHCLNQEAGTKSYSHDHLFHSLLSLFSIHTSLYDNELDVMATCR